MNSKMQITNSESENKFAITNHVNLKIVIFGINYYPEPIGIGKYTSEMAAWLKNQDHQVDVITALPHYPAWEIDPDYRKTRFSEEIIDGVKVLRSPIHIPKTKHLTAVNRIQLETSFSLASLRYWLPLFFKRKKYDVVITICPPMQLGIIAWLYNFFCRVPWVFHIQDLQVDAAMQLGIVKNSIFIKSLAGIEKFLLKRATRISTITESMSRKITLKGISNERIWILPNWSDNNFVNPLPFNNDFRREYSYDENHILIMYAGNMGEKQGLELVLQAADRLRDHPQLRFIMIGNGSSRDRLTDIAREMRLTNLQFLPIQPPERLPMMLAAANIHLVVQRREAADIVMPSKLTNILAAGRPVIATADPGTALYTILVDYKTGFVIPPDELDAFVGAINRLAKDTALCEKMGNNSRKYAECFFNKDNILFNFQTRLTELALQHKNNFK